MCCRCVHYHQKILSYSPKNNNMNMHLYFPFVTCNPFSMQMKTCQLNRQHWEFHSEGMHLFKSICPNVWWIEEKYMAQD